ncbi:hypothetical protein GWI33_006419 [Rhynchophorus ferrugineus]|uniref:Mos1 transposase HTH domain-containing protein n=1 Tax=Rhynchophorus ferrugineus TaxID=354439 RepID=A0A834IL78_RHYFE|nr:hypothetical protein GWI33_006419 [Rhynchophorus ferrugineus]
MNKKEFRLLLKYCFLKGKNIIEAKIWLETEFPDTAPGNSTIKDCYAKFRRCEMSTEDVKTSVTNTAATAAITDAAVTTVAAALLLNY